MIRAAEEDIGEPWECLRCGEGVRSAERMLFEQDGSGGSELSGSMSEYEFSSDLGTDLEGSISSYGGSSVNY